MKKFSKILYISQEIYPYVEETPASILGRKLPQVAQEMGCDTRTFMPKYGEVNERRNQLHEVIRLSGMNLIIDDTDHPLIIKVASIQSVRMQVYFIDNEDYFRRKPALVDAEGNDYEDNDERTIFYARGVLETVKKLRWTPDIIHCQGWLSALAPLYIRKGYNDDPFFKDAKIVYSIFDDHFKVPFRKTFADSLWIEGIEKSDVEFIKDKPVDFEMLTKLAINYSDAVIQASPHINPELEEYVNQRKLPFMRYAASEQPGREYMDFYQSCF